MEEGKYGKYIVTEFYDGFELPEERAWEKPIMGRGLLNGQRRFMEHMVWDSNVIPDAFYAEAVWFWPQARAKVINPEDAKKTPGIPPHSHSFPELLSFYGTDMEHPEELYCQIEFWIDGEKQMINESFTAFIPAGVKHGPLTIRNVKRPIAHLIACDTGSYK